MTRICGVCGRTFEDWDGVRRYCSLHCQFADVDPGVWMEGDGCDVLEEVICVDEG